MDSLEKLLAYKNISPFLSKEKLDDLKQQLKIKDESIERLRGKEIEDMFFLILFFYEKVKNIIPFNENLTKLTDTKSPDGLIVLNDGEKLLVEVKSSKNKFLKKISESYIDKQLDFANHLGIPLYYSVYLNGFWGLYEAKYLKNKASKLKFPDFLYESVLEEKFGHDLLIIPKGFKTLEYYSHKEESIDGIEQPDYGSLYDYIIEYDGKKFQFPKDQISKHMYALTAISNAIRNQRQDIHSLDEEHHIIINECTQDAIIPDYHIILAPIYHTVSDTTGDYLTSSGFFALLLNQIQKGEREKLIRSKALLTGIITSLIDQGIPFKFSKLKELNKTGIIE